MKKNPIPYDELINCGEGGFIWTWKCKITITTNADV